MIKKQHEKFKKTFRLVIKETENFVSKKAIEEIVYKNINFVNFSIEFRIVLKILQQFDQFAQKKKRFKLLHQSLKKRNLNVIQKKKNEK